MVLSFPACLKRYACKNFSVIYIYNIYWGGPAEGGRSVREGGQSHRYRKTKGLKGKNGILKRKRLQILFRHVGRDMLWEDIRNGTERHKQQEGPESRGRKVREREVYLYYPVCFSVLGRDVLLWVIFWLTKSCSCSSYLHTCGLFNSRSMVTGENIFTLFFFNHWLDYLYYCLIG